MNFKIIGRNVSVSERTKKQIEKKIGKLSKLFPTDTTANVTLSQRREDHTVEVTIPLKNTLIRAEETSGDLYTSIDLVEEILERQIKKHHTKLIDRLQNAEAFAKAFEETEDEDFEEEEISIDKVKRFDFKPMSPEEACLEMDLIGHNFFVFKDADTMETCVVYKRNNGSYGMIEPED